MQLSKALIGAGFKSPVRPELRKELGQLVGVATPVIDLVLALLQQRARVAGCY